MSRRLSSIRFAHQLRDLPDPTTGARVVAVWEGIRRSHGAPPDQAAPLMPPALFDVLDACPQTKVWKTRPPEPDLAGLRDRALQGRELGTAPRAGPQPAAVEDEPARRGARARRAPPRRAPGAPPGHPGAGLAGDRRHRQRAGVPQDQPG
jgi:hypothetical protein